MSSPIAATGARPPPSLSEEDEDELDLPPLDGAAEDAPAAAIHDDEETPEEEGAGGDDSAAEEIDPEIVLDIHDEAPLDGNEAARDAIDIGGLADSLTFLDGDGHGSEESGLPHDEEDESILDAQGSDDAGAGTDDDPSAFVDEGALPPLDADDDRPGITGATRPAGAPRAPERSRWRVASGMGAQVPCWLVAASPAHVVAAGPTVLIARDGTRVSKAAGPDIDAVALAAAEDAIFAVARKGALFASVDGGDSWATGSVPWPSPRGGLAIAATPGRLWICEGGALWSVRWSRRSRPEPPVLARKHGVRAMVAAGSTLVILSERDDDLAIERLRGDDEVPEAHGVPAETCAAIAEAHVVLASTASGRALAILAGGAVHVSRDSGVTFTRSKIGPAVAIAFAGDGDDARVVALTTPEERSKSSDLILVEAGESAPSRIADVPAAGAAGRAALVWDAAREVLWVASSAGLVAYERSAQH